MPARLTALPRQEAAEAVGSAEHRSARQDHPAFRGRPVRLEVHPERRVAAGNCCSGADLPDRCLGAGRQPEASAASLMDRLPEVAAAEAVMVAAAVAAPAVMVQPLQEVQGEVAAAAATQVAAAPQAAEALSVALPVVAAAAAKEDARSGVAAAAEPAAQLEAAAVAAEAEAAQAVLPVAALGAEAVGALPAAV